MIEGVEVTCILGVDGRERSVAAAVMAVFVPSIVVRSVWKVVSLIMIASAVLNGPLSIGRLYWVQASFAFITEDSLVNAPAVSVSVTVWVITVDNIGIIVVSFTFATMSPMVVSLSVVTPTLLNVSLTVVSFASVDALFTDVLKEPLVVSLFVITSSLVDSLTVELTSDVNLL